MEKQKLVALGLFTLVFLNLFTSPFDEHYYKHDDEPVKQNIVIYYPFSPIAVSGTVSTASISNSFVIYNLVG